VRGLGFPDICRRCPEIAELKADAASIAIWERWPWYKCWIEHSRIFADALSAAGDKLGVSPDAIRRTVLTGILVAYHDAKYRRAKEPHSA